MTIVLSYGMGVDSTAILLRWLEEPASRDFELSDLIVITAMTGDEWADTGALVEAHVLPRLRAHGVRFVQVARAGLYEADGVEVLSDSCAPDRLHLEGAFRLSQELLDAGTVPTSGGTRKCSQKYKGFVLDSWLAANVTGPYTHVIGFEVDELRRVAKDQCYGAAEGRNARYPLVEWKWNRAACLAYIAGLTGVPWSKSACTFCPFSQGKGEALERYRTNPEAAADVLLLELNALALNPRMKLFARKSALEVLRAAGNLGALRAFEARLATTSWAVYHVRRAFRSAGLADRSVEVLGTFTDRAQAEAFLATKGSVQRDAATSLASVWITAKGASFPCPEEFFVVGPAIAKSKTEKAFNKSWSKAQVRAALPIVVA